MVRRVSGSWLGEGEDYTVVSIVLNHIGTTWTNQERERIGDVIFEAFFPPLERTDVWRAYDQLPFLYADEYTYFIYLSLGVDANLWFKILRLLQVRNELHLRQPVYIALDRFFNASEESSTKIAILQKIVGEEILSLEDDSLDDDTIL